MLFFLLQNIYSQNVDYNIFFKDKKEYFYKNDSITNTLSVICIDSNILQIEYKEYINSKLCMVIYGDFQWEKSQNETYVVLDNFERVKLPNMHIFTFHEYKLIFKYDNFKEVSLLHNNESLSYDVLIIKALTNN